MSEHMQDAARGIEVARDAVLALADQGENEALAVLNGASHAEVAWAAGYLLSAVRSLVADMAGGNRAKTQRGMYAVARHAELEAIVLGVALTTGEPRSD